MEHQDKFMTTMLILLFISFSSPFSYGIPKLLDDFESYNHGSLVESTTPDFTVSSWSRAGTVHAVNPRILAGEGVGGTNALRVRLAWDLGSWGHVRYHFQDNGSEGFHDFSPQTPDLELKFDARIDNSSVEPNTTLDVVVGMKDGNGGTEFTGASVPFTNEAYKTYSFPISASEMTRTSGRGAFDLSKVEYFRVTMRNPGENMTSEDRQWAFIDNLRLAPETRSVAGRVSLEENESDISHVPPSGQTEFDKDQVRVMWVWQGRGPSFRENPELWESLLHFCKAQNISEIFLSISVNISTTADGLLDGSVIMPERIREMVRQANEAGISVHSLNGTPGFADPDNHQRALALVRALVEFNRESGPNERLVGIRMDVEPYTLPEWRNDRGGKEHQRLMRGWVEMNREIAEFINSEAEYLEYGIDIPFWLDRADEDGNPLPDRAVEINGVYQDLARHMIPLVDNIGVMSYRVRATGRGSVMDISEGLLEIASESGTRVFLGLNANPVNPPGIPAHTTFADQSIDEMEAVIQDLFQAAKAYPSFSGVAIHHYHVFRELVERNE